MWKANIKEESTTVTFITDNPAEIHRHQSWTAAASSQIQMYIKMVIGDIGLSMNWASVPQNTCAQCGPELGAIVSNKGGFGLRICAVGLHSLTVRLPLPCLTFGGREVATEY
ncbi:hypothetical protein GOBAR_DD22612 [Gossypium barbadense]|nr:hypothetical protein GOBAR_DD22612 [Gossypium barbadense]